MTAIKICHKCEHCPRQLAGPALCTVEGIDITIHAERRDCPKGKHADADKCQRCGGEHDEFRCPIPREFDPEQEKRRLKSGGCCGAPSV